MAKHKGMILDEAVEALGFKMISEAQLDELVSKVVGDNERLIRERKAAALGPLMGIIMKDTRGRVDAKLVSQRLKLKIDEKLKEIV